MSWFADAKLETKIRTVGYVFGVASAGVVATSWLAPAYAVWGASAGAVFTFVGAHLFSRTIAAPFAELTGLVEERGARRHSLTQFTDRQDCVGRLSRAVLAMLDSESLLTTEASNAAHSSGATQVVSALAEGLQRLAAGEVGKPIRTPFPAEYEALRADFNNADAHLQDIMSRVVTASAGIKTGSAEIAQASDDLSRRTEQQAASLEQTAAAMDQITHTVRDTAKGAADVNQSVNEAHRDAEAGGAIVRDAVAAMDGIEKSSNEIAQIISVIEIGRAHV
jgi:methyl-accepting chemotaxis protein